MPFMDIEELITIETPSSTEWQPVSSGEQFHPNLYVDISKQWERKEEALKAYECEMRDWPHPRSIQSVRNLSLLRGAQVGLEAAEAFMMLRKIK